MEATFSGISTVTFPSPFLMPSPSSKSATGGGRKRDRGRNSIPGARKKQKRLDIALEFCSRGGWAAASPTGLVMGMGSVANQTNMWAMVVDAEARKLLARCLNDEGRQSEDKRIRSTRGSGVVGGDSWVGYWLELFEAIPRVDSWVQEFLRHEIPCVAADYLVEYVCKTGYSLEKHVLHKTHSWGEKSFANLLKRSEEIVNDALMPSEESVDDISCSVCGSGRRR